LDTRPFAETGSQDKRAKHEENRPKDEAGVVFVVCTWVGVVVVIEGVIKDGAGALLARATAEMVDLSKM
jgi:hypothetical protein